MKFWQLRRVIRAVPENRNLMISRWNGARLKASI